MPTSDYYYSIGTFLEVKAKLRKKKQHRTITFIDVSKGKYNRKLNMEVLHSNIETWSNSKS